MEFDDLSHRVIGCAIEFHHALGPGLLESACIKLFNVKTGLLVKFNVTKLNEGINRFIL